VGYQNASRVYTSWGHLPHRPFRMLAYMALLSHDQDDPPVYFGGWESLSVALGFPLTPARDHTTDRPHLEISRAGHHAVKAVVATLRAAGAIEPAPKAPGRSRQRYALHLCPPVPAEAHPRRGVNSPTRALRSGDNSPTPAPHGGTSGTPPSGDLRSPGSGDLTSPPAGDLRSPYRERRGHTNMKETKSPQVTTSPAPRPGLWTTRRGSPRGVVREGGQR